MIPASRLLGLRNLPQALCPDSVMRKPALDLSDIVRPPGTGDYRGIVVRAMSARPLDLLGRAEQSSPNAALRRAEGAGLDCESADRAIINVSRCTSSSAPS